jgi:hypothetical protein
VGRALSIDPILLRNVSFSGTVTGNSYVGGIAGIADETTVENAYSTGTVSGNEDVGGLIGSAYLGAYTGSYTTSRVYCLDGSCDIGGILGGFFTTEPSITSSCNWTNYPDDDATVCVGGGGDPDACVTITP